MPPSHHLKSENNKNSINFFSHSQPQYKLCGLMNDVYYVTLSIHRCRSKQILGVLYCTKLASSIFVRLLLTNFLQPRSWRPFMVWPSKRGFHVFFCKHWVPFFEVKQSRVPFLPGFSWILPRFLRILPKFSTNQNFWDCACTLAPPLPTPLCLSTHTQKSQ